MMCCPDCDLALLTAEVGPSESRVELDYCDAGHGCWLDEGELEALLSAAVPVLERFQHGQRVRRRCPRCSARMRVVKPSADLELDVCPRGDGVWFDPGEIQALASALGEQHSGGLPADLAVALGQLGATLQRGGM